MKFYSRLGDLPETAEIYRMVDSDEVIFVDAGSLPSSHRARITKTPEVFKRIDMSEVKKGKSVTSKGAVTYTKVWYAPKEADLYELKSKGVFLNLDTVPESAKTKIKSKPDVFVHVGKPIEIKEEKVKEVEDKVSKLLTSIVGGKDLDLEKYGTKGVAIAVGKYQQAIDEDKGGIIKKIEEEIAQLIQKADIDGVTQLTTLKEGFLKSGDTSGLKKIKDYGIKRAIGAFEKARNKEQSRLSKVLEKEMKNQMVKGNMSVATKINKFSKALDSNLTSCSKSKLKDKSSLSSSVRSFAIIEAERISEVKEGARISSDRVYTMVKGFSDYFKNKKYVFGSMSNGYSFKANTDGKIYIIIDKNAVLNLSISKTEYFKEFEKVNKSVEWFRVGGSKMITGEIFTMNVKKGVSYMFPRYGLVIF
jgi:hypothetical protein